MRNLPRWMTERVCTATLGAGLAFAGPSQRGEPPGGDWALSNEVSKVSLSCRTTPPFDIVKF